MRNILVLTLTAILFLGCVYIPASEDHSKRYAVLENGGPGKYYPVSQARGTVCLKIMAKLWEPLITADGGVGGPREGYEYWANLVGEGPEYRDPDLAENGHFEFSHNQGTITMDKKNNKVIIDLQRIISKPGEPLKTEPSSANGTYRIKRWIK
jgi:hypothetical protein